jgi:hypothetical protein
MDVYRQVNETIHVVMESCPEAEFKKYRSNVARVIHEIDMQVFLPLYTDHPELRPKGYPYP